MMIHLHRLAVFLYASTTTPTRPSTSRALPSHPTTTRTSIYNNNFSSQRPQSTIYCTMNEDGEIDDGDVIGIDAPPPPPPSRTSTRITAAPMAPPPSFLTGKEGVCRIEVARVDWIPTAPWQRTQQGKSSGTGFVIRGELILTNAHVVQSAVDIRVRQHGSTRRLAAHVAVYAPDVDLALLQLTKGKNTPQDIYDFFHRSSSPPSSQSQGVVMDDEDMEKTASASSTKRKRTSDDNDNDNDNNNSLALELADELPSLQESVHVVGFPTGGRTICITEGVVSRIDLVAASSFNTVLAIQIDAAINPGNSGGPAFSKDGKVTGVAFFKNVGKKTDNVGYLIPADVVKTFLGRCTLNNDTGKYTYTLCPSVPYTWHPLENTSLRKAHQVPPAVHGVLITSVSNTLSNNGGDDDDTANTTILQRGDVLTHIDGKAVADDGQIILRGDELIQHRYLLRGKRFDEPTHFTVFRNGQVHESLPSCVLRDIRPICLRWANVDYPPDYLILGALVLLPMSWSLRSHKACGTLLVGDCIEWKKKWPQDWENKTGLVVLVDILAHELTFSYSRPWRRVTSYNGTPIESLKHLRDLWEASCLDFSSSQRGTHLPTNDATTTTDNNVPEPSFVRIELQHDDDIVLEVEAAMEAESEILKRHQIPQASHISDPNPHYQ